MSASRRPRRPSRRERQARYAGVLHQRQTTEPTRPAAPQIEARGMHINWRYISGTIAVLCAGLLALFFTADTFYVQGIGVSGTRYLTRAEVYTISGIDGWHIFWVDPDDVRQNLLASQSIADAQVSLAWSPYLVNVVVEEREPALIWEQGGAAVWIDVQGRIMALREERDDLLSIVAPADAAQGINSDDQRVDVEIVYGALALQALLPEITTWRYDDVGGLGYTSPEGWQVWLGTGTGMDEKLAIYEAIRQLIDERGLRPDTINIVDPDHPYVS